MSEKTWGEHTEREVEEEMRQALGENPSAEARLAWGEAKLRQIDGNVNRIDASIAHKRRVGYIQRFPR
jgi:phage gp16-like protein